ncbi:hypothetical protein ACFWZU_16135 [Frateuria sp. GZRR33]|uniref:hypothetical protein n=1 Tax=Frateuria sp. GZRR33 TaxID=3351535 RepID=UPI003EDC5235
MGQLRNLLLLPALLLTACSPTIDGSESPGSKSEYSILQVREYDARANVVAAPTFTSHDGYVLLVVPNDRKDRSIWIMLNPRSPPFYKQMPRGSYTISPQLFDVITKRNLVSSTVEEVLASHVAE